MDVDGTLYDVEFVDGRCVTVFSGCDEVSDFAFDSQATATAAGQALLDQVFVDGPQGLFDSEPELTSGCTSTTNCFAYTPYGFGPRGAVLILGARNGDDLLLADLLLPLTDSSTRNYAASSNVTLAVWTVVPEPSTALLVSLGLLAVAARRRA